MKSLHNYILEKLIVNKDYKSPYTCVPKSFDELRKIIEDRYDKLGPGTKDMPIDFNDVDVSNINSFCNKNNTGNTGIFERTKFEYIDISDWNVSNAKYMSFMFFRCEQLKSVGDISDWNVSKAEYMNYMFSYCNNLKSVGDLSNWNVSNVEYMNDMFKECVLLESIGDLLNWNVSKVENISRMFFSCEQLKTVGDLSNWDVSKVIYMNNTFKESGIINIPKWYRG